MIMELKVNKSELTWFVKKALGLKDSDDLTICLTDEKNEPVWL